MWDADGRCSSIVHPDGSTTRHHHDARGRLVGVDHPLTGRLSIRRDADGRPVHLTGPGHERRWTWTGGRLTRWESDGHAVELDRDPAGRVVAERSPAGDRAYRYDRCGRLVGTIERGGGGVSTWAYDAAGRRTVERGPAGERRFRHDAAHRLIGIDTPAGTTTVTWDDAGRRRSEQYPDGTATRYRWDGLGRLNRIDGRDGSTIVLDIDARGDLRAVDATGLVWDVAGQVRQCGAAQVVVGAGSALATERGPVRPDVHGHLGGSARDPWGSPATTGAEPGFGYRGEIEFGGLVWLRNRVYDPATAGFLSPDPLPPVPGAMNPYSYAANDPVGSIDPLGLQPMTDADAQQMRDAEDKPWYEDVWDWAGEHGDEIGAGLLAVGGAALLFTPLAPIGAGILIGMAASAGVQAVTTGEVDARQLWISGLAGGATGGVGAGVGVATAGANVAVRVGAQAAAGAVAESGISAATQYHATGQVSPGRVLLDGGIGAVTGGASPALGDAAHTALTRLRGGATEALPTAVTPPPATVIERETVSPVPMKPQEATARWDGFLGPEPHTNVHPRTGEVDPDRLVSSDGTRSIRFGPHEMNSSPTKFHFHEETWTFDEAANTWTVDNVMVRVPYPKGAW
jgi:RHS repeat-associated protein